MAGGRVLDIADGAIANKMKVKSPTGEFVDATLDKVQILGAFITYWSNRTVSRPVLASFAVQNGANTALTAVAKGRGREIHPTKSGKFTTFAQWSTLGMALVEKSLEETPHTGLRKLAKAATYGLAAVSTVLGADATRGYARDALGS